MKNEWSCPANPETDMPEEHQFWADPSLYVVIATDGRTMVGYPTFLDGRFRAWSCSGEPLTAAHTYAYTKLSIPDDLLRAAVACSGTQTAPLNHIDRARRGYYDKEV